MMLRTGRAGDPCDSLATMNPLNLLRAACLPACMMAAGHAGAAEAPAGVLPMTRPDLATVNKSQCEAAVWSLPPPRQGEPSRLLMRIGNGTHGLVRFAARPGGPGRPDLAERLVSMSRSGRGKRADGRLRVTFGGGLPVEVEPRWFETYQVRLVLKARGRCPADQDGRRCASYAGTLAPAYRYKTFGKDVPTVATPAQPVQLLEWCSAGNYQAYGMFALPSAADKLGGMLLRSR